ncbi:MAG: potassium transporter TrkA [Desulfobulbaceae bacterium]|nr:MAG: potassium transporter TrkA [Desulfobulbaceae bacterium]
MKYLPSQLVYFLRNKTTRRNSLLLLKFFLFLAVLVAVYSVFFHIIMLWEGRSYSWFTGVYWTLTVMSTLGFGDITFSSDLGLFFSTIVLLSGIVFLLVMLPFTFIQFFYAPWLTAQENARAPRTIAAGTNCHVVLTNLDAITENLIKKLVQHKYQYVILAPDLQQALEIRNQGYNVMLGDYGDPETYRRLQIDNAALVVVTNDDMTNTNISFTLREVSETVPIVTNTDHAHSVDILQFAGNSHVFQFMDMLGQSLGRRAIGGTISTNIIWRYRELLIAEAPAMNTALVGKVLLDTQIREKTGVTVVGGWERGEFVPPTPDMAINATMVLMLAGSAEQLKKYESHFGIVCSRQSEDAPVLILGGGRVGQAAATALKERGITYRTVEKSPTVVKANECAVEGNAADLDTLQKAGIAKASSVIVTTHNDAINIYLTIYCRQLRPDIQIIARATNENTVPKLHRAGADLVMSYASLGANTILNHLKPEEVLMALEGLSVFRLPIPESLIGKTLADTSIRRETGCSVVAITSHGTMIHSPPPDVLFQKEDELVLIGTVEGERSFREKY